MLSPIDTFGFILAAVLGIAFIAVGWRASRSARVIAARPTTPIGSLKEGAAEIAGTIHAKQSPLRALNGDRAVAIRTRIEAWIPAGKNSAWRNVGACSDHVEAEARDASGSCIVSLEDAVIVGPQWVATMMEYSLRDSAPSIVDRVLKSTERSDYRGYNLRVTQTIVVDGGPVLLEGTAVAAELTGGDGYRDARERFMLQGTTENALLVSGLSHSETFWRAAWPSIIVGGAGALMLAVGLAWAGESVMLASRVPPENRADREASMLANAASAAPVPDQHLANDVTRRINEIVNAPTDPLSTADGGDPVLPLLDADAGSPRLNVRIQRFNDPQ